MSEEPGEDRQPETPLPAERSEVWARAKVWAKSEGLGPSEGLGEERRSGLERRSGRRAKVWARERVAELANFPSTRFLSGTQRLTDASYSGADNHNSIVRASYSACGKYVGAEL